MVWKRSAAQLVTTGLNGLEEIGHEARHHRPEWSGRDRPRGSSPPDSGKNNVPEKHSPAHKPVPSFPFSALLCPYLLCLVLCLRPKVRAFFVFLFLYLTSKPEKVCFKNDDQLYVVNDCRGDQSWMIGRRMSEHFSPFSFQPSTGSRRLSVFSPFTVLTFYHWSKVRAFFVFLFLYLTSKPEKVCFKNDDQLYVVDDCRGDQSWMIGRRMSKLFSLGYV